MKTQILPMEGASNFRDWAVAWQDRSLQGRLFRSDALAELTEGDFELFRNLGIRTVIDLRAPREAATAPDKLPDDPEMLTENIPLFDAKLGMSGLGDLAARGALDADKSKELMRSLYRSFVSEFSSELRRIFTLILNPENHPVLFHCTAGKDRTGFVAAILADLAGVPYSEILEDYLATNNFQDPRTDGRLTSWARAIRPDLDPEAIRPMFLAYPEFLEESFSLIRSEYGTTEEFLRDHVRIEDDQIRKFREHLAAEPV